MSNYYLPKILYPNDIDSDHTLFLVYNSTESLLATDNEPWSTEIEIEPSLGWADNGFGNINGELFYYDTVEKVDGKVIKLKKCIRNLAGSKTKYNSTIAGTEICPRNNSVIRGMVVAQHHNQLADAVINLEKFIGYNFDTNPETLDYRIRCLQEVPICLDDNCFVVESFKISTTSSDICKGIDISYDISISGNYDSFVLDFGDGRTNTTDLTGTHSYAGSSKVNPVLTVTSTNCQIVVTPPQSQSTLIPKPQVIPKFEIPFPECPPFLQISVIECNIGEAGINLPPIQMPEISIIFPSITFLGNIPSVISFGPVDIPNPITFGPVDIPPIILVQNGGGGSGVPSVISITPSVIHIEGCPDCSGTDPNIDNQYMSSIAHDLNALTNMMSQLLGYEVSESMNPSVYWGNAPTLSVDWGVVPTINVNVNISCGTSAAPFRMANEFLTDEYSEDIGVPSEIRIIAPDLPESIRLESSVPSIINLLHDIPNSILLNVSPDFPSSIRLETPDSIKVEGIPETITILHNIPSEIFIRKPDDMTIELVQKQPLDVNVNVQLDMSTIFGSTISNSGIIGPVMIIPYGG